MEIIPKRKFKCLDCGHEFEEPFGKPRWMIKCPKCGSENIIRTDVPAGAGRGAGRGWWRRRGMGRGRGGGWFGRGRGWRAFGWGGRW
jgi:DNA-directed RNA polymerase subunit RPC12/RpoP